MCVPSPTPALLPTSKGLFLSFLSIYLGLSVSFAPEARTYPHASSGFHYCILIWLPVLASPPFGGNSSGKEYPSDGPPLAPVEGGKEGLTRVYVERLGVRTEPKGQAAVRV